MGKTKKTRLHILLHVGKLLDKRLNEELCRIGVYHGQAMVLSILKRHRAVTQANLARGMSRKPATLTNMLKPMEEKGWIKRFTDPKTNRAVVVSLTEEGEKLVGSVEKIWSDVEKVLIQAVPDEDAEFFFSQMEALRKELGGCHPEFITYEKSCKK